MMAAMESNFAEKSHLLVVDDDDRIRDLLSRFLIDSGFVVMSAASAYDAREILKDFNFDLLILDIMMPGETGLELLADYRRTETTPVIFLTALGETPDRISGLETGADDYISKPFDPKELLLRIRAILKRQAATGHKQRNDGTRRIGPFNFDARKNMLQRGDDIIRLTPVETTLLQVLSAQSGKVLSREELARLCDFDAQDRAIDVQVTRLRRKIEDDPSFPKLLQTVRGQGYILHNDE